MKRIMLFAILLATIGFAVPTFAAPDAEPTTQPVAKVETKATSPTTMVPVVEGKVEVVSEKTEAAKAEAATGDVQKWWQSLLVTVISTVLSIATPVLSLLLVILLRRWNIKVELDKVQQFANAGKNYADQYARNKLKEGKPLDASAVAKIALEKGRELSEGKLAPWAAAKLTDWIEAKCGEDNQDKPVVNGTPAPTGI